VPRMKVRLSIEYEVEDENSELEKVGIDVIRMEADAFAEAIKKRLAECGAQITSFRAEYQ
jgi:hypothetical protein